ncbi:nicotinamide mononucleotide transporter [Allofrancisella guangzhouensis]|uniref:Nicotinamide riboside transporter PnuC n=1 Tax=Allofrancisella guangzhouensis TaxID=594679 RepID=A0A0A8E3I3_9GAMM|nr:nicotinamide riboside transporter PnuC [Allofrancisella guangzhouensis]AJC48543.1 nicotinamide ribonucleoside (NR) uptake permease (PnuC) family protein [Allofrancisella guangzhouensis]MBK2027794.1 nicotinamide mononucleotide transporter [Allofrancisella guangzhouensis]MBK2044784.1 nicotinamide mononucleotide transporter [Allofrancisella guangzhouensis]MBK2045765.1 nicotinamide mononucleotide transporter [Allofrancisella guangzhouensis]
MFFHFLDYFALIVNVLYTIYLARLKVWSWSLGIVGAIILLVLFASKEVYSLVLLQLVYVIFFSFGWYKWYSQGAKGECQTVKWMTIIDYLHYILYTVVLCLLCLGFNYLTHSSDIISTGILTGITFMAIIMTIQKFMENWIVWIISDLYFVVVMYQQELYGQVIQNFIFFLTAVYGFYYWSANIKVLKN